MEMNKSTIDAKEPNVQPGINDEFATVSPALSRYGNETLKILWQRPDLSSRDRSIVTLSALIARNHGAELPAQLESAICNGVTPKEISEIVTHLAFYSGWPNASCAARAARCIFEKQNISSSSLPVACPELLPLNETAERARAESVEKQFGSVSLGLVQYTTDLLFRDLWLRPDLEPRDRSLVTVSALIACGQVAQIPYHLNRAMDNGLTQKEASEMLTHLAFYVGWPNAFSAVAVMKDVFASREQKN
jgi:4-carboxymuconolactone decarboxylase